MPRRDGSSSAETGPHSSSGWTLIELLLVLAILATLASLLVPGLHEMIERAKVAKAIGDIEALQTDLNTLESDGDSLPATLAGIGRAGYLDPWGRPYQYLRFPPSPGKGKGKGAPPAGARKDRFLVPINSSYDLYSMGRNGASSPPLTASVSRDDIVRANDGGFVGLAWRF